MFRAIIMTTFHSDEYASPMTTTPVFEKCVRFAQIGTKLCDTLMLSEECTRS